MVVSGELSMTRVALLPLELLPDDPQAAIPAARKPTAATAASRLPLRALVDIVYPLGVVVRDQAVPLASAGAASDNRQQAAARTAVSWWSAGFSARHLSSAKGHRVLNGQPTAAGPLPAPLARGALFPDLSTEPRLSGSGADAMRSWV